VTRAFTGRPGRSVATAYARAASAPTPHRPAPYPIQRALDQAMRDAALERVTSTESKPGPDSRPRSRKTVRPRTSSITCGAAPHASRRQLLSPTDSRPVHSTTRSSPKCGRTEAD
jgi:hypothetical protein